MNKKTENNKSLKGSILLLIAALIWGSSFVSQRIGMNYVEPFTFNACRSLMGSVTLIPVIYFMRKANAKNSVLDKEDKAVLNRRSIKGGLICGLALSIASSFQQIGISMTSAGHAAFITALYIIIVPVLGIIFGRKIPAVIWLCAALSLAGFYLLCINSGFAVNPGDYLCLICAFCFSVQIMCVDHFIKNEKKVDPVLMSFVQFVVVTLVSFVLTFIFEKPELPSIIGAGWAILYSGIFSGAVAYTFQILGQQSTNPAIAPLIMSLESVFAVLFGWLMLNEKMSLQEIAGCILVFLAVVLSQLPLPDMAGRLRKKTNND